jgi:hypothetical protein
VHIREGVGEHARSAREALEDWAIASELAEGEELLVWMLQENVRECAEWEGLDGLWGIEWGLVMMISSSLWKDMLDDVWLFGLPVILSTDHARGQAMQWQDEVSQASLWCLSRDTSWGPGRENGGDELV